jgi:hypothetical protein
MDGLDPYGVFGPSVRLGRGLALAALLGTLQVVTGCFLVRPPHARELVEIGYRSPEDVFRSFRTAFAADLPDQEFRCFSYDFRRREGLSFNSYLEGRRRLLAERPWMVLMARAEVESSERLDERTHMLVCTVHGRRIALELVRQDVWEMWSGPELLADGFADFDSDVRGSPRGTEGRLTAEARVDPLEYPGVDLNRVTEFRMAQEWKINDFYEAPSE